MDFLTLISFISLYRDRDDELRNVKQTQAANARPPSTSHQCFSAHFSKVPNLETLLWCDPRCNKLRIGKRAYAAKWTARTVMMRQQTLFVTFIHEGLCWNEAMDIKRRDTCLPSSACTACAIVYAHCFVHFRQYDDSQPFCEMTVG